MLHYPRRIAPALLASLVGLMATAAARAEPASPAVADCLEKPNAPSAPGQHWYYRIDRASGRRCWYQHSEMGTSNPAQRSAQSPAQNRDASAAQNHEATPSRSLPARAPVARPTAATASDAAGSDGAAGGSSDSPAQGTVEPDVVAPAQPPSWSTATPPALPSEPMAAPSNASADPTPEPATSPQPTTADVPDSAEPLAAPPPRAYVRVRTAEPTTAPVDPHTHMRALLIAALALFIVILGSTATRIIVGVIRSRRRERPLGAVAATAPPQSYSKAAPGLVPVMRRERDVARKERLPRNASEAIAARRRGALDRAQDGSGFPADAPDRVPVETRALEENVTDLLRRLNSQLLNEQRLATPSAAAQSWPAEDLEQSLAVWRGLRRSRS